MTTFVSRIPTGFGGVAGVPGDKSISHRALIVAAVAEGETRIAGLLESEDISKTIAGLQALGVGIEKSGGIWRVKGVGRDNFTNPVKPLDFGNSGTAARLFAGLLAGQGVTATLTGDASLKRRPMERIITPLSKIGARFDPESRTTLPLTIRGAAEPKAISYEMPVASAQVKSAILLAGLGARGKTVVKEMVPTRDHTERMLKFFGARIKTEDMRISLEGGHPLGAQDVSIPGDFSSAAFLIAAALMVPDGELIIKKVGLNPTRTGFLEVLKSMGANVVIENERDLSGEPIGDIRVRPSHLKAVATGPDIAPRLIDEFPILFVLAAYAEGRSAFRGLGELRHKESDRLKAMAEGLRANGVSIEAFEDGLAITGGPVKGGGSIDANFDHRVAMAFAVLGLGSPNPVTIRAAETVSTSFPGFAKVMNGLGARIEETP